MNPKRWYHYKRYWILISIFLLVFIIGRLEIFEMRYQPNTFAQSIRSASQVKPTFKQKNINKNTIYTSW